MTTIEKCRCCGSEAELDGNPKDGNWWYCTNEDCGVIGPSNDSDGSKWNALMAIPERDPRAVKVEIPVHWICDKDIGAMHINWLGPCGGGGAIDCVANRLKIATVTAWIVPPQVQEIEGEVE